MHIIHGFSHNHQFSSSFIPLIDLKILLFMAHPVHQLYIVVLIHGLLDQTSSEVSFLFCVESLLPCKKSMFSGLGWNSPCDLKLHPSVPSRGEEEG